jgi:hypothetical protein
MKLRALFKRYWKLAAAVLALILMISGYNCSRNFLQAWAMAKAEAKYQAQMALKDQDIAAGKTAYNALAESAGKYRVEQVEAQAAEKRRHDNAVAVLKSESSEKLRERNATIAEVLKQKELDEMLLAEKQQTIEAQDTRFSLAMATWAKSDIDKDAAHAKIVADLEFKYSTCETWRTKIAKSLKPTFWKRVKEYGKYALAFGAGRASAGVF